MLLFIFLTPAHAAFTGNYTLGDLEALYKEGNYKEFLPHALDVRPGDRGRHWTEMVQEMAIQLIDHRLKKAEYPQEDFKLIEDLASWPTLKNDEFFQTKRAAFGQRYLLSCIESEKATEKFNPESSPCLKAIYNFWNNTPNIPVATDLGVKLGEIVNKTASEEELWAFFSRAANSPAAEFLCKKEALFNALKGKIKKLVIKKTSEKELIEEINSLANYDCWAKVLPQFEKDLTHPQQNDALVAFFVLKGKGLLSTTKRDLFLTTYFLNAPANGELFNEAWNELKNFSQDYKRREDLIKSLAKLDPLPGKIFSIEDPKRKEVMIQYLEQTIPEYLDHYAKTCLAYVKGSQEFPMGNPTIECRDMIKTKLSNRVINENVLNELSKSLK